MCHCWKTHHLFYFLAGMSFSSALVHSYYQLYHQIPATHWGIALTPTTNLYAIGAALLLCGLFLLLAHRSDPCCSTDDKNCDCGKEGCNCTHKH